jgi:hypothetical protein
MSQAGDLCWEQLIRSGAIPQFSIALICSTPIILSPGPHRAIGLHRQCVGPTR